MKPFFIKNIDTVNHPFIQNVKSYILKENLWNFESSLVVAVSGGPDSIALLVTLTTLAKKQNCVHAAHVNHGYREGSKRDEEFVRNTCEILGVEFHSRKIDQHPPRGISKEAFWRNLRYEHLFAMMEEISGEQLATGHTADDQLETFFFRVIQGAGPRGILSIDPFREHRIIRPLLESKRSEIEEFLLHFGIPSVCDPTNADEAFPRNFIRSQVSPLLVKLNPKVHVHVNSLITLLRDDDIYLSQVTADCLTAAGWNYRLPAVLNGDSLKGLATPILRRIALLILKHSDAERATRITSKLVDTMCDVFRGVQRRADIPVGCVMRCYRKQIDIYRKKSPAGIPAECFIPLVQGCTAIAGEHRVEMTQVPKPSSFPSPVEAQFLSLGVKPVGIRFRRKGDRFCPFGLSTEMKLKDYFNKKHVPSYQRDKIPLIVDGNGRIVCVVGIGISEFARIDPSAGSVLKITWKICC